MHALKLLLVPTILSMSLAGCATKQIEPRAASSPTAKEQPERTRQINRQLSARCPTPGNLNRAELLAVAGDLEKGVARHWQRTAAEYDRLDDEARACRTGRAS
jgi:hypothetical protein